MFVRASAELQLHVYRIVGSAQSPCSPTARRDPPLPGQGRGQGRESRGPHTVLKGTFEPGWKWSENVKPIAGTDSCQVEHFGYVLSGSMTVHMDEGTDMDVSAGEVVAIPPGHDAEVTGSEPCVIVDFGETAEYAKAS